MSDRRDSRSVDLSAVLRMVESSCAGRASQSVEVRRQVLANFLKHIGKTIHGQADATPDGPADPTKDLGLSPRMLQTLQCLLQGDGEKQIAAKLKISTHTVHVYVKALYKHYHVSSRSELLAKWVRLPSARS